MLRFPERLHERQLVPRETAGLLRVAVPQGVTAPSIPVRATPLQVQARVGDHLERELVITPDVLRRLAQAQPGLTELESPTLALFFCSLNRRRSLDKRVPEPSAMVAKLLRASAKRSSRRSCAELATAACPCEEASCETSASWACCSRARLGRRGDPAVALSRRTTSVAVGRVSGCFCKHSATRAASETETF
jgi:hypothetical protein